MRARCGRWSRSQTSACSKSGNEAEMKPGLGWCLLFLCSVVVAASLGSTPRSCYNDRPIIGILTEPTEGVLRKYGSSRLQAGFVKWVEASGMRAAPIPFDATKENITSLFHSVNGVLFMGGHTDIIDHRTQYYEAAELLTALTVEANLRGEFIPLWGTCLGFELLAIIVSQNFTLMGNTVFASTNVSLPLDFTAEAYKSRMFGSAPKDIMEKLATDNVTDNEHHNAVTPKEFTENPSLQKFFNVLSTNKDLEGREFLSTMEAKEVPIYAVQWHPERTLFEWYRYQNTNHSIAAVECSQYMGRFFASEARKSCQHFSNPAEEQKALIYNYSPTYTMNITNGGYEQIYFFGKT